jgi:hypothetical protein
MKTGMRHFKRLHGVVLAALSIFAAQTWVEAASRRVAVLPFELLDTSLEGEMRGVDKGDQDRVNSLAPRLREALAASGRYIVVPTDSVDASARAQNLQACGGCDAKLAREVGADYAITGQVQKVSNLILNMNVYVRDSATGRLVDSASVDMRGDTDETWRRALDWLIQTRIAAEPPQ